MYIIVILLAILSNRIKKKKIFNKVFYDDYFIYDT